MMKNRKRFKTKKVREIPFDWDKALKRNALAIMPSEFDNYPLPPLPMSFVNLTNDDFPLISPSASIHLKE